MWQCVCAVLQCPLTTKPALSRELNCKTMKKLPVTFGLLLLTFLTACYFDLSELTGDCVRGAGAMVSEQRQLQDFDQIQTSGNIDVYVSQGPAHQVIVKAEPNLLPFIQISVVGRTLEIGIGPTCLTTTRGVQVYVTLPEVLALSISGSGSLRTENEIIANHLSLSVNGAGTMNVRATAQNLISALSSSGSLTVGGAGISQTILVGGSGSYDGRNWAAQTVQVTNTGSGASRIAVADQLDARITGSGSVFYRGNPRISSQITGSGRLMRE